MFAEMVRNFRESHEAPSAPRAEVRNITDKADDNKPRRQQTGTKRRKPAKTSRRRGEENTQAKSSKQEPKETIHRTLRGERTKEKRG